MPQKHYPVFKDPEPDLDKARDEYYKSRAVLMEAKARAEDRKAVDIYRKIKKAEPHLDKLRVEARQHLERLDKIPPEQREAVLKKQMIEEFKQAKQIRSILKQTGQPLPPMPDKLPDEFKDIK